MKKALLVVYFTAFSVLGFSQQLSKPLLDFRDNPLFYNPAFAGSYDVFDASILTSRYSSPVNLENNFSVLSLSSPLGKGNWSLGGNLINDRISTYNFTSLDGIVSYHQNLKNGKLSIGGLVSLNRHRIDTRSIPVLGFQPVFNDVIFTPQFGLGALYQTKLWYLSVSSPNVLNISWTYEDTNGNEYLGYTENDLYISAGLNLAMLNNKLQVLPSATFHHINDTELVGFVNNNLSIGTSLIFFEKVWVTGGIELLLSNPTMIIYNLADVGIGINLRNGLRISGKVEWSVGNLNNLYYGSTKAGVSLGYRFSNDNDNFLLSRRHFF